MHCYTSYCVTRLDWNKLIQLINLDLSQDLKVVYLHNWFKSCFVLLSHDFSRTKIDFPLLVSIDWLWNAQWVGLIVSALHVLQNLC